MQQHLFTFFLLLSFCITRGQALPDRPATATYFNVGPDQKETTLYRNGLLYNKKGLLVKSLTEAPVGNDLYTSYLMTTYEYDSRDSLSGFVSVGSGKPDGAAFRSRFVFTRDERGNKLSDESSLWDFGKKMWRKSARTIQTFDGQNRVTSQRVANYDKTQQSWGTESVFTYTYADRQQILQWPTQQITTFYDNQNRIIRINTDLVQEGKLTLLHCTTVDYESKNSVQKQFNQPDFSQPYSVVTTLLNAHNKPERVDYQLDQSTHQRTESSAGTSISRSYNHYYYDSAGRLLEQVNWDYPTGQTMARRTSGVRYTYGNSYPDQPAPTVYPNLTPGPVHILNVGLYGCVERYEVLNQGGQVVQLGAAQVNMKIAETPECSPKIDLTPLPDGPYIVRLSLGNGRVVSERVVLKKNR